jgi:hypothetical protein
MPCAPLAIDHTLIKSSDGDVHGQVIILRSKDGRFLPPNTLAMIDLYVSELKLHAALYHYDPKAEREQLEKIAALTAQVEQTLSNAAPRHADGGSPIQVFTIPEGLLSTASSRLLPKGIRADLYVVINNALFIGFHVASIDRAVP